MKNLYLALRSSWYYFRREYKRRQEKSAKRAMPDPFTPAIENTVKRIIREQQEQT